MENCKHKVDFTNFIMEGLADTGPFLSLHVRGFCTWCKKVLNDNEIEKGLQEIHSPKMALVLFETFKCKREYFENIASLRFNGIVTNLAPRLKDERSM